MGTDQPGFGTESKKILPWWGVVNGLAVYGANVGTLAEVEASVLAVDKAGGPGRLQA